jgi:hypothetical protein
MQNKPQQLYHGSSNRIDGPLKPVLIEDNLDYVHNKPAVFATERQDIAAVFMFPADVLASIGYESDIAYICIWGTKQEFASKDKGGFLYVLPVDTFEKAGKEYEWQSFVEVKPTKVERFGSVIDGMMQCKAQVYFINDDSIFDRIVAVKNNRAPILKGLISENQRIGANIKAFI